MSSDDVDKLISFGQMALEQGWYDKAREYFEQALDLDPSNREAMKGLVRVNEILSRKADAATEPIEEPARRVEQKRRIPEKKREGQGRSLTQWFKRLSRRSRIAVLAGVPLLFLYLCARLTDIASPTPECREDEPTYKQVVASDESAKVVLYLNSPVGKQAPLETSDSPIAQGLIELIASAEKTIDLAIYGLRNQPMIFEALKEASSRGVVVRIVIDKDLYGVSYYSDTHLL
ncbi:MAG: phospholipase D-like domain-containing protein [Anaerolineae bacterium]